MKPEQSEQFLIEELFSQSIKSKSIENCQLEFIDKLTGDASTRRYYRIFTDKKKFVVCLDNPTSTVNSNTFILKQNFFAKNNIRVPHIYDKNELKGYILEEDLGDKTLLSVLSSIEDEKVEFSYYKNLIDQLLVLHSLDVTNSNLFNLKFDFEKLNSEIEMTLDYFIKGFLSIDDNKYLDNLKKLFGEICTRISAKKMVLTHRDYHSRNIMVQNHELIMIDFQDARMGIPQYDLASLLDDCYYKLTEINKEKLIKYYYDSIAPSLHDQTYDEFLNYYDDMVIQRAFKAVGSFAYIYKTRNDVRYLKYIGFAMEKIRLIMLKDKKYQALKNELFRVYYEN